MNTFLEMLISTPGKTFQSLYLHYSTKFSITIAKNNKIVGNFIMDLLLNFNFTLIHCYGVKEIL